MKNLIIILSILLLSVSNSFGQSNYIGAKYKLNWSAGDFNEFAGDLSYRGFGVDYKYFFNDNFAVGGSIGFTGFLKTLERATYTQENSAITAKVWNFSYFTDLRASAYYHLTTASPVKPYVGLGIGASYVENRKIVGVFDNPSYKWNFGLTPELGMLIHIPDSDFGINISASYNFVTYNNDYYKHAQFFSLNMGMYFCPQWY